MAHLSQAEKDRGYFRLTVMPQAGGKPAEMDFVNGQTEVLLSPPSGSYALKLDFVDNANPGKTMAESITLPVRVQYEVPIWIFVQSCPAAHAPLSRV